METPALSDPRFWSSSKSVVFGPPHVDEEAARLREALGDKGLIVFATSGSSGRPKWVQFQREALLTSAEMVNDHLDVSDEDVWMLALPAYHVGGFGVAARAFAAGSAMRRFAGKWQPSRFAAELGDAGVTLTSLVPTQVHDLVAGAVRAPASLRAVVVGGGALDEKTGQTARDLGWPVLQSYGMTETASQVATASLASLQAGYCGRELSVLSGWECRSVSDGRLQVRGPALCDGYLSLRDGGMYLEPAASRDGWFTTSDIVDLNGRLLTVRGRVDRRLKILGEFVNLDVIERDLRAALDPQGGLFVVALPDERRGWRLVPVLEDARRDATKAVARFNETQPGFARLEPPVISTEIPRTGLGKVDHGKLREEISSLGR